VGPRDSVAILDNISRILVRNRIIAFRLSSPKNSHYTDSATYK
jgi:hypothetical protein